MHFLITKKGIFQFTITLLSFFVFYLSFQNNSLNSADQQKYETFAMGTESFIISRIAVSQKLGIDSYAGFSGRIPELDNQKGKMPLVKRGRSNLDSYYDSFIKALDEYAFKPYTSNVAIQGLIFSYLYNSQIFKPGENFGNYRALFSIISALIFSFLSFFFLKEFGVLESILTIFFVIQLDWIVASASHLFWFTGFMFAPFVFNMFFIGSSKMKGISFNVILFFANIILVFGKVLISGFEVIPSFLVMTCLPVFYFFFKNKWSIKKFSFLFLLLCISSLSGVGSAMFIQANKIDMLKSKDGAGREHLVSSFFRRSSGKDRIRPNMPDRIKRSYEVSSFDVIRKYWSQTLISGRKIKNKPRSIVKSNHLVLIHLTLCLISIFGLFFRVYQEKEKLAGLVLMSVVSIISPLSMFVSFKSLSWLHPHLVPITWNMPYAILVFLLGIYLMKQITAYLISTIKQFRHV